ncbi:MAG: Protein YceI [Phycisphaerales bacterium]|nr:Protein YceI [Phycisphaerales bacterium]
MTSRRGFGAIGVTVAVGLLAAGTAGFLGGAAGTAPGSTPMADTFQVDAVHSSVLYRIKHLNTAWSYGRFNDVSGTFNIAEGGTIDVTVKTDSVDSGNEKRDGHLKSPDFFSAKEFPEMSFKSSSITKTGDNTFEATGTFTLKGVSKELTVPIEKTGEGPGMRGQGKIQGFEAKFTINRSEYGMNFMPQGLSEQVTVIVSLEGGSK